ncbi:Autotransporter outer membrane beta-barrel domain-containing protein [Balamuthia mandrillaris]
MRRQLAGPGTNKHVPKKDIGKEAPASTNVGDGYRQKNSAAGPQSSHAEYVSTKDSGVQMPVSGGGGKEYFS